MICGTGTAAVYIRLHGPALSYGGHLWSWNIWYGYYTQWINSLGLVGELHIEEVQKLCMLHNLELLQTALMAVCVVRQVSW